jgi:AraC-like DNA-binding protein
MRGARLVWPAVLIHGRTIAAQHPMAEYVKIVPGAGRQRNGGFERMALPDMRDIGAALFALDAAGAAIGLFAALRLQRRRIAGAKADRLLGLLLVICSANVVHGTIAVHPRSDLSLILEPLQFLIPLGIAWYLRVLGGRPTLAPMDAINLVLPAAFIAGSRAPGILGPRLPSGIPNFSLVMWLTMGASSAALMIPVARDIHRYRAELKRRFSSLEGMDPGWLQVMLLLSGALFLLYALLAALMIHAPSGLATRPALAALTSAFTIVLAWSSLGRRPLPERPLREEGLEAVADRREGAEGDLRAKAERLVRAIAEGKLYLEPELCLDDLAAAAGMSRHQASEALNRGLGSSFFDLINGYRVEEFKRLCADPGRRGDKIMTLALDSGFNSKPSFNLVFKNTTGMTPTRFRASLGIGSHPIA